MGWQSDHGPIGALILPAGVPAWASVGARRRIGCSGHPSPTGEQTFSRLLPQPLAMLLTSATCTARTHGYWWSAAPATGGTASPHRTSSDIACSTATEHGSTTSTPSSKTPVSVRRGGCPFAADILVGDDLIAAHLCPDVTANGVRALARDARGSSGSLLRAGPGAARRSFGHDRVPERQSSVSSNGGIYSPGGMSSSPRLTAAERARSERGRLSRGLRYASGRSWLEARADVCVSDDILIAVITRGRHKYPGETVWSSWTIECPQCAQEYTPKDSPGECFQCGQSRCPRCGACDCPRKVRPICRECFTELSASEASNGRTLCGQCE